MPSLDLARTLAVSAAVAGTGLLGASLGGMAAVDRELAATAAPAPALQAEQVVWRPAGSPVADRHCARPAGEGARDARPEL